MTCMTAKAVPRIPKIAAAPAMSPPCSLRMSWGNTGMITPKDTMSSRTVMKMKMNAARDRVIMRRFSASAQDQFPVPLCAVIEHAHRAGELCSGRVELIERQQDGVADSRVQLVRDQHPHAPRPAPPAPPSVQTERHCQQISREQRGREKDDR